ncbi:hypothetical protein IYX23_01750 [Methylocystis sp. L43]|uniref:NepR family anti-sigma factor n=1 Tax=unclassified Methylocystis TaxID=2625913 RepID=UPI0018C31DE5|nr:MULTISPECIES: NepR family anti-sigma factor [unclassified Methylocystis]MBG0796421.1 hypothetical protein [Methylocystis sp. L43]MBG0804405.1 hypothetical protein [Methylocystis sp. H15]
MTLHLPVFIGVDGSDIQSAAQGLFDMNKKAEKQTRRGALREQRHNASLQLSFLGIDGQLTSELRHMYETSISDPMPDKVLDLLARLSSHVAK